MQSTNGKLHPDKKGGKFDKTPISNAQIDRLTRVSLNINSFQRSARPYYKTSRTGYRLTLISPFNGRYVHISFIPDNLGYITVYRDLDFCEFLFKPTDNRDLFKKLRKNSLI